MRIRNTIYEIDHLVFQAHRYGPDFEGLKGKMIDPNRFEWTIREKGVKTLEKEKAFNRLKKLGH